MNYLSVCSGIEAASVAWHPLGWRAWAYSEIERFPSAVLAHHYPDTPNLGDMTKYQEWPDADIDLLVGGTPCQSFSVAGLRKGLADPRGNLMLKFGAIAGRYRPRWLVWENVSGVLSSNGGRDFGTFLGMLAELGYGFAYRILDAQYFRVAQRRRRVFVVGYLGDWRRSATVLFERQSLSGHPAPRRETREGVAPTLSARTRGGGGLGADFDCDGGLIAGCLNSVGGHAVPGNSIQDADQGYLQVCAPPLETRADGTANAVLTPNGGRAGIGVGAIQYGMAVRRLTPVECERLQGFPDGYTDIRERDKPTPDGPRYKALGNSMAVPCMRWIGERIAKVDALPLPLSTKKRTLCTPPEESCHAFPDPTCTPIPIQPHRRQPQATQLQDQRSRQLHRARLP